MILWHNKPLCSAGFVINLASRPDRKASAIKELEQSGISGFEFYNATTLSDPDWQAYGCTQSHLDLFKIQIENNIDYLLILEDDIHTSYTYSTLNKITKIDKQIKYAHNCIDSFHHLKPDLLWLGSRVEQDVDYYDDYISFSNKTLTAHAYISSLSLAKFCVENFKYNEHGHLSYRYPIDFFLSQLKIKTDHQIINNINNKAFVTNNLVTSVSNCLIFNQKPGYSNIIHKDIDYGIWIAGCHEHYCFNPLKNKINYHEYI